MPRTGAGRPKTRPKRIIADKAYDSDPLRQRLKQRGIVLFSPHRRNRKGKRNSTEEDVAKIRLEMDSREDFLLDREIQTPDCQNANIISLSTRVSFTSHAVSSPYEGFSFETNSSA